MGSFSLPILLGIPFSFYVSSRAASATHIKPSRHENVYCASEQKPKATSKILTRYDMVNPHRSKLEYSFTNILCFFILTEYYRQNGIGAHYIGVRPIINRMYF